MRCKNLKIIFADAHVLQRQTLALVLTTTFLATSAQSTASQKSPPPAAKHPEMMAAAPQAVDLALRLSSKSLKCCVRFSILSPKTTCFLLALLAVAQAAGPVSAPRDCPFWRGPFSLRRCPLKWKPCLKTKCSRPARCPHSRSLGEPIDGVKHIARSMLHLSDVSCSQAKYSQQYHWC